MEHWVRETCEPSSLFLAWQGLDPAVRFRWAVGKLSISESGLVLRYFSEGPEFERNNDGRHYDEIEALGFRGYPAFSTNSELHTRGVEAALLRRLPPRSRSDFVEYTKLYRLPSDLVLSNLALLGRTEAKLPSDGFSLVDPLCEEAPACDLVQEIAGFQYYVQDLDRPLTVGERVEVHAIDDNPHDPNAVAFKVRGQVIGYVNRLQAKTFRAWLRDRKIEAWVERLNGDSQRPRAFLFVEVRPSALSRAA